MSLQSRKGMPCPYKPTLCSEGYCDGCQIYIDYEGYLKTLGRKEEKMTTAFSEGKCPSCGSDWVKLEADLLSPLEYVAWPGPSHGGFLGKSEKRVTAEQQLEKCDCCKEHFKRLIKE